MQGERALFEAGIVKCAVQPAISGHRLRNQCLYLALTSQIGLEEYGCTAVGRYRLGGTPSGLLIDISDQHVMPGRGQDQPGCPAYPSPRPRHDEGLALKNSSHTLVLDL